MTTHVSTTSVPNFKLYEPYEDECILHEGSINLNGYGQKTFNGYHTSAHRIAWIKQYGFIPEGKLVLHKCDNKLCININHLFIGTQKDNMIDMVSKNRQIISLKYGIENPKGKLTNKQVQEIRTKYIPRKYTGAQLAKEYNVSESLIYMILKGTRR